VWDIATGKERAEITTSGQIAGVSVTPDGKQVVAWIDLKRVPQIDVYSLEDGKRIKQLNVHDSEVTSLAFNKDASLAAVGDAGGSVRVWDIAKGERVGGDLPAHTAFGDMALSPDKKTLVTGGEDGEVKIWDLERRETRQRFKAHKTTISAMVMSDDGSRFATMSAPDKDREVAIWETATGKELRRWSDVDVKCLEFTPDGKYLATGNANTTVYLLECP
jgi:WD40 repeat protein